jgi:ATP-binding cassette subfamily B protein
VYGRAFRWVWEAARLEFLATVLAQVLGAVALGIGLLAGRSVVERLTDTNGDESLRSFVPAVLVLGVALLVSGLATVATSEARVLISELVSRQLQSEIIEIAGSVDYEQYETQDFHDLLDRATTQGVQSSLQLVYDTLAIANTIATSVVLIGVVATTVPEILPGLALVALPFLLAARASGNLAFRTLYDLTPDDRLRIYLYSALRGVREARELRVFELQSTLHGRWKTLYASRLARIRRLAMRRTLLNGLATAAGAALVAAVLLVTVDAALDGRVTLADAAVAIVALQQLSGRVRGATSSAGSLRRSVLFLDDFERFRSFRRPQAADVHRAEPRDLETLRVEGLSFTYPGTDREVLHDIDLELRRGEVVALVGVSGSGKSTLAHLVAGLYRPTSGRITWDGVDITTLSPRDYWRSVTAVFQDFARYQLTAHENVTMSDHRRADDLAAAQVAARRAGIEAAIDALPAGWQTMMSRAFEGGADLSVGQWQRIAVARAFFRDATLLLFDEPASALDPLAEQDLYRRIEELCGSGTVLLVSHRFSTVRLAQRIYVMADGRIVEHGTHGELMAKRGHYAQLFEAQAAGYLRSV